GRPGRSFYSSLRVVPAFCSDPGSRQANGDADLSPLSIGADVLRRIRHAVEGVELGGNLSVDPFQILRSLGFEHYCASLFRERLELAPRRNICIMTVSPSAAEGLVLSIKVYRIDGG